MSDWAGNRKLQEKIVRQIMKRYADVSPIDLAGNDHIVPRRKGGANGGHNLALACRACNRNKWHDLGWRTLDGRTGFFWDGTPGDTMIARPRPPRARECDPVTIVWPARADAHRRINRELFVG